jgi:hypothetical protein
MLPATNLEITAEVFNNGKKPFVIKPLGRLEVLNDDVEQRVYLVKLGTRDDLGSLTSWNVKEPSEEGLDVVVEPFLPEIEGSSYVLVPPGGSISISATSVEELGEAGKRLRSIFDASVLRCRLTLVDSTGRMITSDELIFGTSADSDLERELLSEDRGLGRGRNHAANVSFPGKGPISRSGRGATFVSG